MRRPWQGGLVYMKYSLKLSADKRTVSFEAITDTNENRTGEIAWLYDSIANLIECHPVPEDHIHGCCHGECAEPGAGTAKYIASLCELIIGKYGFWEPDHGNIKAGVFYERHGYTWTRLEISKKAARLMNSAFKKYD